MTTAIGAYATAALLKSQTAISDTTDDTVLGYVCDRINAYIESRTQRVLAPITSATYLYDGDGTTSIYLPFPVDKPPIGGLRAVTLVELQLFTAAGYTTLPAGDTFLRQQAVRASGAPYERLVLSDFPTGGFLYFPRGFATVRVTGTAGWAAIPDDITEVALVAATRAWHAVQAGQADMIGTDEMGRPLVSRFFSARDLETLDRYGASLPG